MFECGVQIPNELGQIVTLKSVNLCCNLLQGPLDALGGLTDLDFLDLTSNSLRTTIPAAFSALTKLGTLRLSVNRLTGRIPDTLSSINTTGLKILLDQNYLTGLLALYTELPIRSLEV